MKHLGIILTACAGLAIAAPALDLQPTTGGEKTCARHSDCGAGLYCVHQCGMPIDEVGNVACLIGGSPTCTPVEKQVEQQKKQQEQQKKPQEQQPGPNPQPTAGPQKDCNGIRMKTFRECRERDPDDFNGCVQEGQDAFNKCQA